MHRGYIKLWRSSVDNKLYFAEPFTKWQAWQDLLLLANHKNSTTKVVRGITVEIKRGQVLAGEEFLAERWKWSRGKVRRFLQQLEAKTVQQIVQQKNNVITIISIVNWEIYQGDGTTDGTAFEPTNGTTDGQQTDTPKKDKNVKNTVVVVGGKIDPMKFYSDNFETLKPFSSDVIKDLITTYGEQPFMDAMQVAIKAGVRNLRYIEGVLKGKNGKSGRIPADGKYHTMEEIIGHVETEEESEAQS